MIWRMGFLLHSVLGEKCVVVMMPFIRFVMWVRYLGDVSVMCLWCCQLLVLFLNFNLGNSAWISESLICLLFVWLLIMLLVL